jgi:2-polyprenyl-6-methoxyphenol hydroxylase-like FAD-dependent oxidoreductase
VSGFAGKYSADFPALALAEVTPDNRLLHFGLWFRRHKAKWSQGRAVLLGDACHATLPYVGQG